jgi:4-alpha-glucanotransferase
MIHFLRRAGLHFWQILPINPTAPALGNSPYTSYSAFAGYELLISPELLAEEGWLDSQEAEAAKVPPDGQVDFGTVVKAKARLMDLAFQNTKDTLQDFKDFNVFCEDNCIWLNDYALFMAAKDLFRGAPWQIWPADLRERSEQALSRYGTRLAKQILRIKFGQFIFFRQLGKLKSLLKNSSIGLIGDISFYVNHDSSDVWANRQLFALDADGQTRLMAGVPPDYFSKDGQLWGNPIYDWEANRQSGYGWWLSRLGHNLGLFDWCRLDHFRAFASCWAVPAGQKTAVGGYWLPGPGGSIFSQAAGNGQLNIIAEDLGIITPDVTDLRRSFSFPGMRVLQFGFGKDQPLSTHTPFRIEPDNCVYASTHDNNTARGWFRQEATATDKMKLSDLSGFEVTEENVAWALTRLSFLSPGAIAIATVQDLLSLDEKARLNTPGTPTGNWGWRLESLDPLTDGLAKEVADLTELSGRDNMIHPNILRY